MRHGTATLLITVALVLLPAVVRAQQSPPGRVLVLYWYDKDFPGHVMWEQSFKAALQSGPGATIEYFPEYLQANRFPGKNQFQVLHQYLRQRYADHKIDVLVAHSEASLNFLLKYRDDLFPHTPVVFYAASRPAAERIARPDLTGLIVLSSYRKTLHLALGLHPRTEHVFVISGTLERDRKFEAMAREELREYENRVQINYLTDLPPAELTLKTKTLPEHSIVLYVWQQARNEHGKLLESVDILSSIARTTPAPIYGMSGPIVGYGIIGGYAYTHEAGARRAAEIARRILDGERVEDIPIENVPTVPMFDWRELRRWRISEDSLPPGSVLRFQELSLWDLYRWQIIGVFSLCLVEACLIFALLVQRARRGRAEAGLRESHNRIQHLAGRLIVAQEEERKHVARELHDDLSQQVAALAIGLAGLERHLPDSNGARAQLMKLDDGMTGLSERIRRISHQLHSSTLEHVGLVEALKLHCSEFLEQNGVAVTTTVGGDIEPLPPDTALCLYRVAQESLRNVVKHSGARSANLTLLRNGDSIEFRIVDHGTGFDQDRKRDGLGLVSMEERVRLLGGSLEVKSQPGAGTELRVYVPAKSNP